MFRFLSLFVGVALLACGFALAVVDGTRSIGAHQLALYTPETLINMANAGWTPRLQAFTNAHAPYLWRFFLQPLLHVPAFLVCWLAGGGLFLLAQRRSVQIGFSARD